jgi:hypothetical protein
MSNVSSVANTASVAAATSQVTIASLQAQMARYSQSASGQNGAASADYKALQSAITSGNVTAAQAALVRLQRDSNVGKPAAQTSAPATSTVSSPVDNHGNLDATA